MNTITHGGYTVTAPAFTEEAFATAIGRALASGLTVLPTDRPGLYRVAGHGDAPYWTSSRACSCPAGQHGRPCKHRALVALLEAITGREVTP